MHLKRSAIPSRARAPSREALLLPRLFICLPYNNTHTGQDFDALWVPAQLGCLVAILFNFEPRSFGGGLGDKDSFGVLGTEGCASPAGAGLVEGGSTLRRGMGDELPRNG